MIGSLAAKESSPVQPTNSADWDVDTGEDSDPEEDSEDPESGSNRRGGGNGAARRRSRRPPWSREEEAVLCRLHAQWGCSWSRIAKELPGRTSSEVKNIWHSTLRSKKLKARSLLRAYARALSSRGDRSDDAAARTEAFRIAVRMTSDGRDSDGGGPDDAPDGLPSLALPKAGASGGAGAVGTGLGAGDLQGVGAGGTAGLDAGPPSAGLGGGAGPRPLALPGLSAGGGGRGGLPGLGLAAGGGGPLDGGLAARLAGAGLMSGNGACRTGSSGEPANNGPNPTTHPSSPDRSTPHADNAAVAAAVAQLNDLQDGIYSSRGSGKGTTAAAARGGGTDKNGGAAPQLPPADRLVAALMQGTGLEDAGRAGDGGGGGAGVKLLDGGLNGGSADAAGGGDPDAWAPAARGGGGGAPAGAGGRNGQATEGVIEELQQLQQLRGLPPQLLQQLLAKGVSPAALQAVLLQARLEDGGAGLDELGLPLPLPPGLPELAPRELASGRQVLDGDRAGDSWRGREQQQPQQSRGDDARATPPPPQRQVKQEEREAQPTHNDAQRAAGGAQPRVRVKAEADAMAGGVEDGARSQQPDTNDGAAALPAGSREDCGAGPSRQGAAKGREGLRAQDDQGGKAAKTQPHASQSHRAGLQQEEQPQQSLDNGRRGAGPVSAAGSSKLQMLPPLAAGSIEAAARASGALAVDMDAEVSGNGNCVAGSLRALRESDDERLDGGRGPRAALLQAGLRPQQGDMPSPRLGGDVDARDSGSALRALAAAGGGHPLQALAAALAANGGAGGGLGGVLAGLAASRDGGGGGLGRLEQLAALMNGGGASAGGPGGGGGSSGVEQLGMPGGQGLAMLSGAGGGGGGGVLGALLAEAQRGRAAAAAGLAPLGAEAEETALMEVIRVSLADAEAAEAARARAANRALEAAARLMQFRQARARAGAQQLPPESMLANALASACARMGGPGGPPGGDELLSRLALLQSLHAGGGPGGAGAQPAAADLAAMLGAARGGGGNGVGGGSKRHALSDDERERERDQLPPRKRQALTDGDEGPALGGRGGGGPLLPLHHLQLANVAGAGLGPGGQWGGDMLDAQQPQQLPPQQQQLLADMRGLMSGLGGGGGGGPGGRAREQDILDMLRNRAAAAMAGHVGGGLGGGGALGHLRGPAGARGMMQEDDDMGPGAAVAAMAAEAALRRKGAGLLESQDSMGEMAQTLLGFSQMAAQTLGGSEPAGNGGGGGGRKGQRW